MLACQATTEEVTATDEWRANTFLWAMNAPKLIAQLIHRRRLELGMDTMQELSTRSGVSYRTIQRVEAGEFETLRYHTRMALSKTLGIDPDDLRTPVQDEDAQVIAMDDVREMKAELAHIRQTLDELFSALKAADAATEPASNGGVPPPPEVLGLDDASESPKEQGPRQPQTRRQAKTRKRS